MNIKVSPHLIEIERNVEINAGEYNITPCVFEFSEEYEGLINKAIFSTCGGENYPVDIVNNECVIPFEVLQEPGKVLLGVYGYSKDGDTLILRYSPTPKYFAVSKGSFAEGVQPVPPTPGIWDRLVEQVEENTEDISSLEQTKADKSELSNVAFSGSYEDLTNKPTIPTKTSELTNDSGYITKDVDDLTNYTKTSDLSSVATSGDYNDLINKPDLSIYATSTQLGDEATARQSADNNLQSQIDGITASSDVVDIVGTYAELQSYDTTHLGNNDIIKVLQDSTHNNAMTYYRWDKPNNQWIYVGQEGPYYTKSETNTLLQAKQDTLVSGTNIKTINGSSILASGNLTLLNTSKVKNTTSTTSGDVYDVVYINTMIGDIESILTTLDIGGGV